MTAAVDTATRNQQAGKLATVTDTRCHFDGIAGRLAAMIRDSLFTKRKTIGTLKTTVRPIAVPLCLTLIA